MRIKKAWVFILLMVTAILILALFPTPKAAQIQYFDRQTGMIKTEKVASENWLIWLYNNPVGEATMWALVKRKIVSSIYGDMMDSPSSVDKIKPFVEEFNIDMSEAQKEDFNSFNDFFTRKLKSGTRPIDTNTNIITSPADGKVMAWANISDTDFLVKGHQFNVSSFLKDEMLSEKYTEGSLVVNRLAPNDYHRFHFPISGSISNSTIIEGDYYSVNPIALREMVEILCMNKREYVVISNPTFGAVVMAEVGATMVGSIIQTYKGNTAKKGAEKGFFEFGGSTVVLIFEPDKINIDQDLLDNTKQGLETKVEVGERIASILIHHN